VSQRHYRICCCCLGQSPQRRGVAQEEILQHKLPLPPHKRPIANAARYLSIVRLRPCFDFDHSIIGAAVRASEWIECRWPAPRHGKDDPYANIVGTRRRRQRRRRRDKRFRFRGLGGRCPPTPRTPPSILKAPPNGRSFSYCEFSGWFTLRKGI
jgi:hypothetical protein